MLPVFEIIDYDGSFNSINGMPIDGRIRPVFAYKDNVRIVIVSDGKGNGYNCKNDIYLGCDPKFVIPENLIDPTTFKFERGISGQEF